MPPLKGEPSRRQPVRQAELSLGSGGPGLQLKKSLWPLGLTDWPPLSPFSPLTQAAHQDRASNLARPLSLEPSAQAAGMRQGGHFLPVPDSCNRWSLNVAMETPPQQAAWEKRRSYCDLQTFAARAAKWDGPSGGDSQPRFSGRS